MQCYKSLDYSYSSATPKSYNISDHQKGRSKVGKLVPTVNTSDY
jgi:hypothetical protein